MHDLWHLKGVWDFLTFRRIRCILDLYGKRLPITKGGAALDSRESILKTLSDYEGSALSSRDLVRMLGLQGINVVERTVRYHLKILDESGLTAQAGRAGHRITHRGMEIVQRTHGSEVDFVRNHYYNLACMTDLDMERGRGQVILNVVTLPKDAIPAALAMLGTMVSTKYMIGDRVLVAHEGEVLGGERVAPGCCALGVVSSATVIGIMVNAGLPVLPSYIGLLQVEGGLPRRFNSIIGFQSISHDVLSIYMRGRQTNVSAVVGNGAGRGAGSVVALFMDLPTSCVGRLEELDREHPMVRIEAIGVSGTRLLDLPVGSAKAGLVINDGINACAYLAENGLETGERVLMVPWEYGELLPLEMAVEKYGLREGAIDVHHNG